jgi:hypothetical protein
MSLEFKIRVSETNTLKAHSELSDVMELKMSKEEYLTGEQLSEEFRMTKEATLQILDSKNIKPIAKIVNRGPSTFSNPQGTIKGGRPRLAFNPQDARRALAESVEQKHGNSF